MTDTTNFLEVKNLSKTYDSFKLQNICFSLPGGCIMGLIGPNGSGKTTTVKAILNMIKPDSGSIRIMGYDSAAEEQKAKSEVGAVFDASFFSDEWTVCQTQKVISAFYPRWDRRVFGNLLKNFGIPSDKKTGQLSKGMQMKLSLACALSYDARLLILDEPTSGLDPVSRDELLDILLEYVRDGEHSVLFSSHITGDLERAAERIAYISCGEMLFCGGKDEFTHMYRMARGNGKMSARQVGRAVGCKTFPDRYEALVKTEDAEQFPEAVITPASIDEIIVYTDRREKV